MMITVLNELMCIGCCKPVFKMFVIYYVIIIRCKFVFTFHILLIIFNF